MISRLKKSINNPTNNLISQEKTKSQRNPTTEPPPSKSLQQSPRNISTHVSLDQNGTKFDLLLRNRGIQQPNDFQMNCLSSLSVEQVMKIPFNPPSKSTDLHLLINRREWVCIYQFADSLLLFQC